MMRNNNNSVYNAGWGGNMAPGVTNQWMTGIYIANKEISIKSISWDLRFSLTAAGPNIPLQDINMILYYLLIGDADNIIGRPFMPMAAPAGGAVQNGLHIQLNRPQQLQFDSFYVKNACPVSIYMTNHDLVQTYYYATSVTIETEETL